MAKSDSQVPTPDGRPPRRRRALLASLLENWLERAEEAGDDPVVDAESLAAVFGFLRRTDERLLEPGAWQAHRERIEQRARLILGDAAQSASLAADIEGLADRLESALREFQAKHDRAAPIERAADARRELPRARPTGEERIQALQLAERVDRALLAAIFALEATPSDQLLASVEALAVRASHAGECFHSVEQWFSAMERSIDPALRSTRWAFRGDFPLHSDRALHASSAWLTRTHARIRQYQQQMAEEAADLRQTEVLGRIEAASSDTAERWRQLATLNRSQRDRLLGGGRNMQETRLLIRLAQPGGPVQAAASFATVPADTILLEWASPDARWVARCRFSVGERSDAMVVHFFDEAEASARAMDGSLAHWLGLSATIANGQARFPVGEVQRAMGPSELLPRIRTLFVGEAPWISTWEQDAPTESEP